MDFVWLEGTLVSFVSLIPYFNLPNYLIPLGIFSNETKENPWIKKIKI